MDADISAADEALFVLAQLFRGPSSDRDGKDAMADVTASDRPATFEAAFTADAAAADSQTATPAVPTDSASAPATGAPVDAASPSTEGPIPFERHKSILEGVYKERDTFKSKAEALAWAEQMPRESLEAYARRVAQFERDPYAWMSDALTELQAHPQHGQGLRSWVARTLAGFRGAQTEAEITPGIPVHDETGREVARTYTHEQINQLVAREVQKAIGQEVTPLKQQHERIQEREQQATLRAGAEKSAADLYAKAQSWPGFKEHEKAIAEAFSKNPEWSLHDAYIAVAVPKLQQTEQAKVLETLEKKAAASTASPSSAVVTSAHRPKSFHDPSLTW